MRKLLFYFGLLTAGIFCTPPAKTTLVSDCDFLKNLTFKNGKATVLVKAYYTELIRSGEYSLFGELEKRKLLDREKYFRLDILEGEGYMDAGSAITFVPVNCNSAFTATVPLHLAVDSIKFGQVITVRCTVFKGEFNGIGKPFFVADDIIYDGKDLPAAQNIQPLEYIASQKLDLDAGISCFSDDGGKLMKMKCLFAIFKDKKALVSTSDHKDHYFNLEKHTLTKNGYMDTYRDKNGNDLIELNITCEKRLSDNHFLRIGKLSTTIKGKKNTITVYGF